MTYAGVVKVVGSNLLPFALKLPMYRAKSTPGTPSSRGPGWCGEERTRPQVASGAVSGSNPVMPEMGDGGGRVPSWCSTEVKAGALGATNSDQHSLLASTSTRQHYLRDYCTFLQLHKREQERFPQELEAKHCQVG